MLRIEEIRDAEMLRQVAVLLALRALFGVSSEKRPAPPASAAPPAPPPHHGHGPKAQPRLPRVDVVHQLDEADRVCPACGGTLPEMPGQTEDAEEITVVGRQFVG